MKTDDVKEVLAAWGEWSRRDNTGLGFPGETAEHKYSTRNAEDRSRKFSDTRKVTDASGHVYDRMFWGCQKQTRVMTKSETFMPDHIRKIESAITDLPADMRQVAVLKYVRAGMKDADRIREYRKKIGESLSRTEFYTKIDRLHWYIAAALR